MKIYVNSLALEITRKCNMTCDHCLRGEAQNVDIKKEVLEKIAESIDSIQDLTFTGGEPSLNVEGIAYLRHKVINKNVYVGSFFVATNGKDTEKLLDLTREALMWNAYCIEKSGDTDMSSLALSTDQFHEPISEFNENILRGLSFFSETKMNDYMDKNFIINEGRANENGLAYRGYNPYTDIIIMENGTDIEVESTLYINVFGDVISGCDWSFESQEEMKMGNILEEPLYEILLRNATKDLRKMGA